MTINELQTKQKITLALQRFGQGSLLEDALTLFDVLGYRSDKRIELTLNTPQNFVLAAYNPETGATAHKQTGSFYTPRGIVNYMVDESLIAYLESKIAPDELTNQEKGGGFGNPPRAVSNAPAGLANPAEGNALNAPSEVESQAVKQSQRNSRQHHPWNSGSRN